MNTETISYLQVQELVRKLPDKKLPIAYRLLSNLHPDNINSPSLQHDFMSLPLEERQSVMRQQAENMLAHYEQNKSDWQEWQAGEFLEY